MIAIPSGASIYLCTTVTDMRKSFDGLSGLIRSEFQREPNDGSLFYSSIVVAIASRFCTGKRQASRCGTSDWNPARWK